MQKYKSPNSSKSRMFYLALGCKERVEEEFENRVTRWNPQKDVWVHGHARSNELSPRLDVRGRASAQGVGRRPKEASGEGGWSGCAHERAAVLRYCSTERTVFVRNEEINLK
ncbi:hypothetical protein CDL15_Pgr018953 [Punica granatum]|uniref:Uncharacterized protein n=1 Tax=Punica granatum TaxID=22663 RepID=A0A218WMR1_PUNGR|nr:hypothetical protein CDL15_Pgr018953 [Punica granatum]